MSDGHKTLTLILTNAQYDVLKHAITLITKDWQENGTTRQKRDIHTIERAMQRINEAWDQGIKY